MPNFDPHAQLEFAHAVALRLRKAGYQSLWAGGCVRDQLLGRVPKDYDVATNATPEQIRELFGHRNTLAIGAAFGVIAVLGSKQSGPVDVTTFRRDANYSDGRRPDAVEFCDAEEDAARRDFTINGLFFDPIDEQVIDYVGGQQDIERRVLRAIGDPRQRLEEDKLRMLRAVRFAAAYELQVDAATRAAVAEQSTEIHAVSPERIAQEMRRMLTSPGRVTAWDLLVELKLLDQLLPEARVRVDQTRALLGELLSWDFSTAMAGTLWEAAEHQPDICQTMVDAVADRWRLTNQERARLGWLLQQRHALDQAATADWPRLQRVLTDDGAAELIMLVAAARQAAGQPLDDVEYCRRVLASPKEVWNPPPLLNGDDLIAAGIPAGKHFKAILEQVRDAQLLAKISTPAEALLWARELNRGSGGSRK